MLAQRKGAKAVLATLWPVADASTGSLMRQFYALRQGERLTKAEALRRAQLELLRGALPGTPDPATVSPAPERGFEPDRPVDQIPPRYISSSSAPFAHPYYWAPFILLGNGL